MAYATRTEVGVDKTRTEIERLVNRHGAENFAVFVSRTYAQIAFTAHGRRIRFTLPLPDADSSEFALTSRGQRRSATAAQEAWEQACRSRWRALLLCIKAKLESVESRIETWEEAFLGQIVLDDGATVYDHAKLAIADHYSGKHDVPLLPAPRHAGAIQ